MEFDRCSHAIFHFFSKYLKTFNHKNKKIQADGCMLNIIVFQFLQWQTRSYNKYQYSKTYTLCGGLNHVNYLNIIKRNHVSVTVRTRLHLASGWSLDHSGAQYSYVGVRTQVGCRHMISFYNIPPIISVIQITIVLIKIHK